MLKVARTSGDRATLLASLTDLTTVRFAISGQVGGDVPEDAARDALTSATAVIEVDDRGRLVEMRAPKNDNRMFADVMHALATELSFELAKNDAITWISEERTMTGLSRNAYRVDTDAEGTLVERRRAGYAKVHALRSLDGTTPSVEGGARIRLDEEGSLVSFEGGEEVRIESHGKSLFASTTSLSIRLASRAPFTFGGDAEIASFEVYALGKGDPRAADRALAKKFSREDLAALVAGFAATGSFGRGDLARAAAYVRLHPEECKTLEAMFDRQRSANGKAMVFDVLLSAGSPEAQESMRRLLDTPAAKRDASLYRTLVQRLGLLTAPTHESMAYLRDVERSAAARADAELGRASLVALGSVLRRRVAQNDADARSEARALIARAKGDLSSRSTEDRAALLLAVGSLRDPDATETLAGHAKDESAQVRASVATGLRHSKDPRATRTLLDLMGDEDSYVAATAIDAHLGRRMDAKELDAFAEHVRSSATSPGADTPLAAAILRHADTNPAAVRSVLESLLARTPEDTEEAARLRTALANVPS